MRLSLPLTIIALSAPHALAQEATPHTLEPGVVYQGSIGPEPDEMQTFQVSVPAECVALRLELSSSDAELVIWGTSPSSDDEQIDYGYGDDDTSFIEAKNDMSPWVLLVDRFTIPSIETGEYTFEVTQSGLFELKEPAEFELSCTLFKHGEPTPLPSGEVIAGALTQSSGCFQSYSVEVPKSGAKSLRIDLFGSGDDLVLLARRGRRPNRLDVNLAQANDSRGRKTLVIDAKTRPRLRSGTWHIDVVDPQNADRTANYKLHAAFDGGPPEQLLRIPSLPARLGPGPLGASLAAVVELYTDVGGGSGTFIDSSGRILTNAHVVSLPDGEPTRGAVSVAVSLDPRRPPVELFNARVLHFDLERDLAVLELIEGYYHQPLPVDLHTPFAPLAPAGSAEITNPLWIAGYPWTGGFGRRVSLSLTAGIVTGFDWIEAGVVIKTDAEIASGNSGGAAFDAQGRLVGVPTATIGGDGDKIGYLHPTGLIPPSWLER